MVSGLCFIFTKQEQNEILSSLPGLKTVRTSETDQVLKRLSAILNKNTTGWPEVDFCFKNFYF
jgi:hypothetical protein